MLIPNKIAIAGLVFEVIYKQKFNRGEIDFEKQVIDLNPEYSRERQEQVFIHELIHGIADVYGVKLKEKQVTALSSGIYDTFKNAGMFR